MENTAYCSFVSTHYIICECGDNFPSDEALRDHLEKDHKNKDEKPSPSQPVPQPVVEKWISIGGKKLFIVTKNDGQPGAVIYARDPTIKEEDVKQEIKCETSEEEVDYVVPDMESEEVYEYYHQPDEVQEVLTCGEVWSTQEAVEAACREVILKTTQDHNYILRGDPTANMVYCDVCGKAFLSEKAVNKHYGRMHRRDPQHSQTRTRRGESKKSSVCDVCGKNYASNAALRYHQRIHTGEKPYKCTMCPKAFTMRLFLQIHTRTHTGERPFQCASCPKAFSSKAALLRHDRVHTGIKPYQCPECDKAFTQSNSMKLHIHTVHRKLPTPYKSQARRLKSLHRNQMVEKSKGKKLKVVASSKIPSKLSVIDGDQYMMGVEIDDETLMASYVIAKDE